MDPFPDSSAPQLARTACAALAASVPAYTFASDADGALIHFNPRWRGLLGAAIARLVGTDWNAWTHPEDRDEVARRWSEAVAARAPFTSQHRVLTERGPVRMSFEAQPAWSDGERFVGYAGYAGCAREVSADHTDSLDARCLAHDLKNLLTVALGHLELDVLDGQPDAEAVGVLREALMRAAELSRELLGQEGVRAAVDLNDVVARVLALYRFSFPPGVRTRLELDPRLASVPVYFSSLWRALSNLVSNAAEAMPQGGVLSIETRRCGDVARLTVHDTGRGCPQEDLEGIFEPHVSGKHLARGRGLGLVVVRACARLHGGQAHAEARAGSGTAFHLELPLEAKPNQVRRPRSARPGA